jgi:hypothetical protein
MFDRAIDRATMPTCTKRSGSNRDICAVVPCHHDRNVSAVVSNPGELREIKRSLPWLAAC